MTEETAELRDALRRLGQPVVWVDVQDDGEGRATLHIYTADGHPIASVTARPDDASPRPSPPAAWRT